mmetsp:Transcript_1892/g.11440  ORF Transcript_1892/g.11440 Transcript_1892/m.11440 type:complete len:282 (-) Transcript_1892:4109-4954(-)
MEFPLVARRSPVPIRYQFGAQHVLGRSQSVPNTILLGCTFSQLLLPPSHRLLSQRLQVGRLASGGRCVAPARAPSRVRVSCDVASHPSTSRHDSCFAAAIHLVSFGVPCTDNSWHGSPPDACDRRLSRRNGHCDVEESRKGKDGRVGRSKARVVRRAQLREARPDPQTGVCSPSREETLGWGRGRTSRSSMNVGEQGGGDGGGGRSSRVGRVESKRTRVKASGCDQRASTSVRLAWKDGWDVHATPAFILAWVVARTLHRPRPLRAACVRQFLSHGCECKG